MSVFGLNSRYIREVLISCFHLKKTAAEAHRIVSSTYGEAAFIERTYCEWFRRFKSHNFDVEDRHGGGKDKIFEDFERLVLNTRRIDRIFGCDSTSHFKTRQTHGNDTEARKLGSVRVDAEKCKAAFLCLCAVEASETITGDRYRTQWMRLSQVLEKWPQYQNRHDKVILQHGNARTHVASPVKTYLETLKRKVTSHPTYSPDFAPSDYHFFRSVAHRDITDRVEKP